MSSTRRRRGDGRRQTDRKNRTFTLPVVLVEFLGYATIPATIFIAYFILGLEEVAAEIENPFGEDANDLPLDQFTTTIRSSVFELLCEAEGTLVRRGSRTAMHTPGTPSRFSTEDLTMMSPKDMF